MANPKPSFRVYLVAHQDGRLSGTLLRRWDTFFDAPPPAAYGVDQADVLAQLEVQLGERDLEQEELSRYLWTETFSVRRATVKVHPQTAVDGQPVVGARRVPLRLSYATCALKNGAYRVMLPRFGWWFVVEDLNSADEALRNAVSGALLGKDAGQLYDFRREGDETVLAWVPDYLRRSDGALQEEWDDDDEPDYPVMTAVAEELVDRAARRKLPRPVGEDPGLLDLKPLVDNYPPPSILLVGQPGVGKTTAIHRMARQFALWRRAKTHENAPRIWHTSGDRIIAGMVYLGMWQKRCFDMIEELRWEGDYLYIDRLSSILTRQSDGGSVADLLAPTVIDGEISLLSECTPAELEHHSRSHPALLNALTVVRVPEAPTSEMPALLSQYRARVLPHCEIHPEALARLVQYLDVFYRDTSFPGKGIRFVDWLAGAQKQNRNKRIYPSDIAELFSRQSGLPVDLIDDDHTLTRAQIRGRLAEQVVGQPTACDAGADVLVRFKSRLGDPDQPVGTLLFVGPTGVGKTEMAKQLCRVLFGDEKKMIRLDMSEYLSPHAADRLLGSEPGGNSLAQRIRQNPLSLVLLDEIEKAHPRVFDLLLGVLGEGRLTDDRGRLCDFRMALIVMTSNLGAGQGPPAGFEQRPADGHLTEVRRFFRPEFLGRIDQAVPFRMLDLQDIEKIVDLTINAARRRRGMRRREIDLNLSPAARRELARRGHHPTRGARPLKRVIDEQVVTPVAVRLAADPGLCRQTFQVVTADDGRSNRGPCIVLD